MSMGLYAMPKFKDCDSGMVYAVEGYLDAVRFGYEGSILDWVKNEIVLVVLNDEGNICSDEELNDCFTPEMVEFYKGHYKAMYWPWDTEHKNPRYRIAEEIISWEYAPHILDWFISNTEIASGRNDVDFIDLVQLLKVCLTVSNDHSLAPELLPINEEDDCYDEEYFAIVQDTIRDITKVLLEVDFDEYIVDFDCD